MNILNQIGVKKPKKTDLTANELSVLETSAKLRGLVDLLRECQIIEENERNEQASNEKKKEESVPAEQDLLVAFDEE